MTPVTAGAETVDRIVANVNGEIILLSDVRAQMALIKSFKGQGPFAADEKITEPELLRRMIDDKIIAHYAKENNIVIKESEVDQTIEQIKATNRITSEFLEEMLKGQGMSMPQYREKLKNQMLIQRVTGMEIGGVNISDDETLGYYRRNQGQFLEPGRVRLSHIVSLAPEEAAPEKAADAELKIRSILKEVKGGASFAELAKRLSEDGAAANGGDLGWFTKGKMLQVFEETAFSLKKGEVGGPIRTQFGVHIIMVTDKEEPIPVAFEKVENEIREKLMGETFARKRNTWIERLRQQAYIEAMY